MVLGHRAKTASLGDVPRLRAHAVAGDVRAGRRRVAGRRLRVKAGHAPERRVSYGEVGTPTTVVHGYTVHSVAGYLRCCGTAVAVKQRGIGFGDAL